MNIKNKKKNFVNIIILLISLIIVVVLCMFLLDTTGRINQGNFRINDLAVFSLASVEDTETSDQSTGINAETDEIPTQEPINDLSDLRLNVSQKNEISFLVAKLDDTEIKNIYLDDVKVNYPVLTENMYIYQKEENKIDLKTENIKLDLDKEDKDGQYLIKVNIDNINCIKGAAIPDNASSIVFDGTIFSILNTKISDITFDIQFNLNILGSNGRLNICKVKLFLPNELLVTNGVCIIKEYTGNFPFRIK